MKKIINFIIILMVSTNLMSNDVMSEIDFANKDKRSSNVKTKTLVWKEGKILSVNIEYASPTKIVFPAYIEKIEFLEGVGGIYINKKNFAKGDDSILLTRKKDINKETLLYATVLGKRMTFIIKYAKMNKGDAMVKIVIPIKNNKINRSTKKKVFKKISSKDLTRKTNIKSVGMLTKIYNKTAWKFYDKVELNKALKNDNSFLNFWSDNETTLGNIIFKKLFNGNRDFYTAYNNKTIIPLELYEDNYVVVMSNKNKRKMYIYGLKMKWCNYSDTTVQITIDDVKSVIGKNILSVKHPMIKTPPKSCDDVIVIFYKNGK